MIQTPLLDAFRTGIPWHCDLHSPEAIKPTIPKRLYPWLPMLRADLLDQLGPKSHWRHLVDDRVFVLIDYYLDWTFGYNRGSTLWPIDVMALGKMPYSVSTRYAKSGPAADLMSTNHSARDGRFRLFLNADVPTTGWRIASNHFIHVSRHAYKWAWERRAMCHGTISRWISLD